MDTVGPYLTFIAGFPILILGLLVLSFTTEDDLKKGDDNEGHLNQSSNSGIRTGVFLNRAKHLFTTIFVFIRQQFSSMSIVRDHTLLVGIFSLAAQKLARPMLDLLLQYMSKRFRWKVSKVNIIIIPLKFKYANFVIDCVYHFPAGCFSDRAVRVGSANPISMVVTALRQKCNKSEFKTC